MEENLGKYASKTKIKHGESKLFKKDGETSNDYLRKNLFQNPCIIKSEKCKYFDAESLVTIYYNKLTDLFAIIDSKQNKLLDFGIATEVKYAEIFASKSCDTVKRNEICSSLNISNENAKSENSKNLKIYQEQYLLSVDDTMAILEKRYGSNFLTVENGEVKIQEWQAAKKINGPVGIVAYVRKGNKLPRLDLIRAYQNAIKNFCEDRNQSVRNDKTIFRGEPSITFFNVETRQIVIFNRETKIFITAYKIRDAEMKTFLDTGIIGKNQI